jgi:hypothetical protein
MPPPGFAHATAPQDLAPVIAATLEPGWRIVSAHGVFERIGAEPLDVAADLPKGSRVVYTVPTLAEADPAKLGAPERDLARHVRVILPRGADPVEVLGVVKRWACIERAQVAPSPSLP